MDENLTSMSLRVTFGFQQFAKSNSGGGKRFKDISACARYYIELGQRTEKLIEIRKNPEKQQEFDEKLQQLMKQEEIENVLETCSEDQLDSIIQLAMNQKKQKVQTVIDLVNKS